MRICHFAAVLATLGAIGVPESAHAQTEKRVALVIGNGAYQNTTRLPNPRNDAEDVSAALKRAGFETVVGLDLGKTGMDQAAARFARAARDADVAVFYYSGHAMQFGAVNYLMPVDAQLNDEADLRFMARVDDILTDLQQAKSLRILVLDSCRDNPLAEELKRSIGRTRAVSIGRGLARIESAQGMIVAYSTQAGRIAEDGMGRNSPYTAAFLKHFETQEEIGTIFRRISNDVYQATRHQQLPELSLSLIGEFYLRGKQGNALSGPGVGSAPPPSAAPTATADEIFWTTIRDSDVPALFEEFVNRFPASPRVGDARSRLNDLKKALASLTLPAATPQTQLSPPASATPPSLTTVPVPAAEYPTRPVKLIVPFGTGGSADQASRIVADWMSRESGQPFLIENRPGAGGAIGAQAVASATPDGYTLLVGTSAVLSITPIASKVSFDPGRDFMPAGLIAASPQVLVVYPSIAAKTLAELIAMAKGKPGQLSYASQGSATVSHLAGAQFASMAGINMVHVPYRGSMPALNDLMAGHTHLMIVDVATALPLIRDGKLRALAVVGPRRNEELPNVLTMTEQGLSFEAAASTGLLAPKGTSPAIIAKLNALLRNAVVNSASISKLRILGLEPTPSTPEEHARIIDQETARWSKAIREAGIAPN